MWTQIIKKMKQQQKNLLTFGDHFDDDDNNDDVSKSSDDDHDSSGSIYSPPTSSILSDEQSKKNEKDKNKKKHKEKDQKRRKKKDKARKKRKNNENGKEEEDVEEEMRDVNEEITLTKVTEHVEKILSKKRNGQKLSRFGNNSLFYVYHPSFQDKTVAVEIENLLQRAMQRVTRDDNNAAAKLKFVLHPSRKSPKYIVIEQELTSEQLDDISCDHHWWKTYPISIIKTESLFNQLMKWNQLNGSIKDSKTMKLWENWKQMINENEKKNDNEIDIENGYVDLSHLPEPVNHDEESAELKQLRFEYEKVTKKPDTYMLNNDNIWRLYGLCNHDYAQELEVISTEVVSYICGIEWDYDEENQSKMNNNPCWDEQNQKRKDGTGYAIEYGMKFIFGSGGNAMNQNWWKKKALFFTLNDVPITYDSINSEKQYAGQHWFSMAVQQYHDNQSERITNVDWNIFDSFNEKKIINQFKNSHVEPIRCFLNHIYNKMHQWNVNIPRQPKQTMYQNAQTRDNYYDCGIYCCISLNYLFMQFTEMTEINKNKNRKQNIKLREIETIPMEEGSNGVTTLRQLLTNDIMEQYQTLSKEIIMNESKEDPVNEIEIEEGQYISFREKSEDPLPKHALSWKYVGKVMSIGKNKKSDEIQILGINKSDNENPTELRGKTSDFINTYQWRIMNTQEKNAFKENYSKTIQAFYKKNNNDNNDTDTDSTENKLKKRRSRKRHVSSLSTTESKPSKKRRIENNNGKKNPPQSSHTTRGKKRKHNQMTESDDSETDSETEEGEIKEKQQTPSKKRRLMKDKSGDRMDETEISLNQTNKQ